MTDPLDDLKSALNSATPAPDADAKARNIALATKNFANLQGSRQQARPISRPTLWIRTTTMLNSLTSRGALTATTAIVAAGVMIATPFGRDMLNIDTAAKTAAPEVVVSVQGDAPQEEANIDALTQPLLETAPPVALDDSVARSRDQGAALPQQVPAPQLGASLDRQAQSLSAEHGAFLDSITVEGTALTVESSTETFANEDPNSLKITTDEPVSTFSIDVDTAAYSLVRSSLTGGQLPPPDAVRIEELVNYFPYDYPAPDGDVPFEPTVTVFDTPWNADTQLVHIGIQGELPAIDDRPPLNLVFLIDTSGSMERPNKLPLLRQSFRLMLDNLSPDDEVAIVTYAGATSIALDPTPASDRAAILAALNALSAGGSTNGQGGLEAAYTLAETMKQDGDVSRILLATDGDFNVGLSDPSGLETYIEDKRDTGTYLSVLGFGRGNLQDATMQSLPISIPCQRPKRCWSIT